MVRERFRVRVGHMRTVVDLAAENGCEVETLCRDAGLDLALLEDEAAYMPLEVATALYDLAAERTKDPAFGLHVAERSDFYAFDTLGFAISTKKNLREAFEHLSTLITTLHGTHVETVVVEGRASLTFSMPEDATKPCRQRTEAYAARAIRLMELATGTRPSVHRVAFRHAAPEDTREHERVFRCAVVFGAPRHEIVYDAAVLEQPLPRADPRLSKLMDHHLREFAARSPARQSFGEHVRRYVREAFPHGDFSVEAIGRRMGIGARTLQRRLGEEGTSLRALVELARQELAIRYVADTLMPIKEIAQVLGYSELRAFYRAFERWTGLPPASYRRESARPR
jgi:AraC-like DNA-binding protein